MGPSSETDTPTLVYVGVLDALTSLFGDSGTRHRPTAICCVLGLSSSVDTEGFVYA